MNAYKFIDEEKKHLHTLDGKPLMGTTTVLSVINKPLAWWASGMAVGTLGWTNKKNFKQEERIAKAKPALEMIKDLEAPEYLDLLDKAYQAHNEKKETAAEEGTSVHEQIETYIKALMAGKTPTVTDKIKEFAFWAERNVKRFLASELYVYSREQWLGGCLDFIYEDLKDDIYIGDIKSSREAYFSQFLQCALYHIQLVENQGGYDKDGNRILELDRPIKGYAVCPFGSVFTEPTIRFSSEQWLQASIGAVALYKLNQNTNG